MKTEPKVASVGDLRREGCESSPKGWRCTRDVNHEGPCAAVKESDGSIMAAVGFFIVVIMIGVLGIIGMLLGK